MVRQPPEDKGAWNFRDIPRGLMNRVKMAAAYEGKNRQTVFNGPSEVAVSRDGKEGDFAEGEKLIKLNPIFISYVIPRNCFSLNADRPIAQRSRE